MEFDPRVLPSGVHRIDKDRNGGPKNTIWPFDFSVGFGYSGWKGLFVTLPDFFHKTWINSPSSCLLTIHESCIGDGTNQGRAP